MNALRVRSGRVEFTDADGNVHACRPATEVEMTLWEALHAAREQLRDAGLLPVAVITDN